MGPLDTVKAALRAYVDKDRNAIEALVGPDYHFTSPLDNAIDRETYFQICWPNSEMSTGFDIIHSVEEDDRAFVVYEGHASDKTFRNCELHHVVNGKMVSTEVYFGWNMPHPNPSGEHVDPNP